ncbi:MAG TPA: TolC family protein [Polyangia bacterium]|jgi:outer membrane protein|nr:TolC family protein [Polyangia bacterium]
MSATLVTVVLATQLRVLTLADAVSTAESNQPALQQVRAQTEAAQARADQARAPLLPQLTGNAFYQRTTANFIFRPGFAGNPSQGSPTFDTFNYFSFNLTLSQYIWDFGQTTGRWRVAQANAAAQESSAQATGLSVVLNVRTMYFAARAQKSLVQVAHETLANQERHLQQISSFVRVGTRPEIDLVQARTDRANAEVSVINAENAYESAKAALNQAMGVAGPTDYDVEDATIAPVEGEDQPTDTLVEEAVRARPDLAGLEQQLEAQRRAVTAAKGGYWPAFNFATSFNAGSTRIEDLRWNWSAQVNLSWQLFNGLLTRSQIRETQANQRVVEAQKSTQLLAVRVEIEQARLAVRAARAALGAAEEALTNASERLRLAEGRYQTGVGNAIELGDAQVALTNARAQKIQAEYNLATARARLLTSLGRR